MYPAVQQPADLHHAVLSPLGSKASLIASHRCAALCCAAAGAASLACTCGCQTGSACLCPSHPAACCARQASSWSGSQAATWQQACTRWAQMELLCQCVGCTGSEQWLWLHLRSATCAARQVIWVYCSVDITLQCTDKGSHPPVDKVVW